MLSHKQRKLFYILHEILKRDIRDTFIDINKFIKDFGISAYNFKKSFNLTDEYINVNKYECGNSKNFMKNFDSFINNLYYNLNFLISNILNSFVILNEFEYNESEFICNYKIYEGLIFLINEFDNYEFKDKLTNEIIKFNYINNYNISIFNNNIGEYMKRFNIYKNENGELMRDEKKIL